MGVRRKSLVGVTSRRRGGLRHPREAKEITW